MVDRKKIGRSNSKRGKVNERAAAKILTKAFYEDFEIDGRFIRTPQSGAWGGLPVLSGDLVGIINVQLDEPIEVIDSESKERFIVTELMQTEIDTAIPFFWEIKTRKRDAISAFGMLEGKATKHIKWWKETDAKCPSGHISVVAWKVGFSPWFVFLSLYDFDLITEYCGFTIEHIADGAVVWNTNKGTDRSKWWVNLLLSDFLEWVVPAVNMIREGKRK